MRQSGLPDEVGGLIAARRGGKCGAMIAWTLRRWDELGRDDVHEILAARQRVFVVEQVCPFLDADGLDRIAWHLWTAAPTGAVLAYLRILPPGSRYEEASLARVLTASSVRRTGLGRALVAEGLRRAEELFGSGPVRIDAQSRLRRFYAEFGFVRASDEYDEDGIPHIEMLRATMQATAGEQRR